MHNPIVDEARFEESLMRVSERLLREARSRGDNPRAF